MPPQKKSNNLQTFITILLVFRFQLSQIPAIMYYFLIAIFLVLKYQREGNNVGSILQYVAIGLAAFSEGSASERGLLVAVIISILNHFLVCPTLYTLPSPPQKVGLKDNSMSIPQKEFPLYWSQWFPITNNSKKELYTIPWNHTVQLNKIAEYIGFKGKFMMFLFNFFTSHIRKCQIVLARGDQNLDNKGTIVFSHGRTATPFMYSTVLCRLARFRKVICPQHSQRKNNPYSDLGEMKKFRQAEVKERSEQIGYMISLVPRTQKIILMGHSYGCSTILQSYQSLSPPIRSQISHIILLDPWLFPLPEQLLTKQIDCPILFLANEHFIDIQDVYIRNSRFVELHSGKIYYYCWRGGDHLHQTDMGFVIGSSLGRLRNYGQSGQQIQRNLEAIQCFLADCSKQQIPATIQKLNKHNLGMGYKPPKWKPTLNF